MFRAFLEARIVELFGPSAGSDAAFQRVVDQVQDAMSTSPEIARAIARTTDTLLQAAAAADPSTLSALTRTLFPGPAS